MIESANDIIRNRGSATDKSGDLAPIALFVYNRPQHTKLTVEALKASPLAERSDLHVFSDAPRDVAAAAGVQEVRKYLNDIVGFRSITVVARDKNYGLSNSVIEGVSQLCATYGKVIVLEDDLLTSVNFLSFMNEGLAAYEQNEQVMQIAGYMFPVNLPNKDDALFLSFITSWGWATWSRAWKHFDPNALAFERLRSDAAMRRRFDLNGNYQYFKMLKAQRTGKVDSWAIRWYLSVFVRDGLALYPRKTLVNNLGFDGSGVNCAASDFAQEPIDQSFSVQRYPSSITVSDFAETVVKGIPKPTFKWSSVFGRVTRLLRRF